MIEKSSYPTCKENVTANSHDIKGSIERTAMSLDEISRNVDFLGFYFCGIHTPDEVKTNDPHGFLGVAIGCEENEDKAYDILRRLTLLRTMIGAEEYTGDR